jgi:hypothetical protein
VGDTRGGGEPGVVTDLSHARWHPSGVHAVFDKGLNAFLLFGQHGLRVARFEHFA